MPVAAYSAALSWAFRTHQYINAKYAKVSIHAMASTWHSVLKGRQTVRSKMDGSSIENGDSRSSAKAGIRGEVVPQAARHLPAINQIGTHDLMITDEY